ncbi:uncharacterized protein BCR38DRAFT_405122 [Pseudomassariella vexata]|uniref:Uncharacterized protein n=1 Tax=Pseudomassariella vexata TaxID=1141098 RepID=A0A1Y2EKP1_9PEZI|nr:uncharacterized protein BCR38DRAFT_405122 [Pseudomassariella vexata]ORY72120.1 hypothetical protein BCR38DRAFT_405122 [Pseudomassariella vexata]
MGALHGREPRSSHNTGGQHPLRGPQGRRKNAMRWVLSENPQKKAGIPTFLRALVLLKRNDMDEFTAVVTIDVDVSICLSLSKKIRSLFSKDEEDDPENFDPEPARQPRNSAWVDDEVITVSELQSVKLEQLDVILSTNMRNDVQVKA